MSSASHLIESELSADVICPIPNISTFYIREGVREKWNPYSIAGIWCCFCNVPFKLFLYLSPTDPSVGTVTANVCFCNRSCIILFNLEGNKERGLWVFCCFSFHFKVET